MTAAGFLRVPEITEEAQRIFDVDVAELGYVMNTSKVWAYQPAAVEGLFDLLRTVNSTLRLSIRERGILTSACAATFGDSYCALMWGWKLADAADPSTAAAVLAGDDAGLSSSERAMAAWARKVVADPSGTSRSDIEELRAAGYDDAQIFGITVFVALRLAFSTVNDALGAQPDAQIRSSAPAAVLQAVTFGRPIEGDDRLP